LKGDSFNQLRVALIQFVLSNALDQPLDLGCVGGKNVVVFPKRRSRQAHVMQGRSPSPMNKDFLFSQSDAEGKPTIGCA
jgi:hypothetical protein